MARYTLPIAGVRQKGKRLGIVLQKAGSQFVIRRRVVPVDKKSIAQQAPRSNFAGLASQWRDRTAPEKATFATERLNYPLVDSLGNTYYQPSTALFNGSNINLQVGALSVINSMPAVAAALGLTFNSSFFSWPGSDARFVTNPTAVPANTVFNLFCTRVQSLQVIEPENLSFLAIKSFQAGASLNTSMFAEFTAVMGDWSGNAGKWLYWRVEAISTLTGQSRGSLIQVVTIDF
jgi:hypothetical protein